MPEDRVGPLAFRQVASHPDSLSDAVASCQHCHLITAIRPFCSMSDFIPLGCTGGGCGEKFPKAGNPGASQTHSLEKLSNRPPTNTQPELSPWGFSLSRNGLRPEWGE